tara:strand:- start:287 stop:403 length:117 start_codon:yes stop_codon:yes gene_type:complete
VELNRLDKCEYGHYLNENNKYCIYCKELKEKMDKLENK